MRFEIITGMSGAGKRTVLKFLEDLDYFCVDNLPVALMAEFAQMVMNGNDPSIKNVALGIDIRNRRGLEMTENALKSMREAGCEYHILFLESSDDVLIRRFKETRRAHPLAKPAERLEESIKRERQQLAFLKKEADNIIDTSLLLTRELNAEIKKIYEDGEDYKNLYVSVFSFGFKYGVPTDADLVFDVRFLPNPYYDEKLRPLTGNDAPIRDFVMKYDETHIFIDKLTDMLDFLMPRYVEEGKNKLVIAIGCTGGRHRSVVIANAIYDYISKKEGYGCKLKHLDMVKDEAAKGR